MFVGNIKFVDAVQILVSARFTMRLKLHKCGEKLFACTVSQSLFYGCL